MYFSSKSLGSALDLGFIRKLPPQEGNFRLRIGKSYLVPGAIGFRYYSNTLD
jgi:hypothetical protein